MPNLVARAYNNFKIYPLNSKIVKNSSNSKLKDEANYLNKISKTYFAPLFPRIFGFHQEADQCGTYVLQMEYYTYKNLYELLYSDEIREEDIKKIFNSLTNILDSFSCDKISYKDSIKYMKEMYITKTTREYLNLINKFTYFNELKYFDTVKINNVIYKAFQNIWPTIRKYIEKNIAIEKDFSIVHGDFCISNMLCSLDKNFDPVFKFIDPRGSFGKNGIYGDSLYDIAKLMHSIEGNYELIINDNFKVTYDKNTINYSFDAKYLERNNLIKKHFNDVFGDNFNARLVQGLIFIGMCARHYDSLDRQVVMYSTGIKILNECWERIKDGQI